VVNEDYLPNPNVLERLPFRLAGRLPDDVREQVGEEASSAQWDLLLFYLAGVVVHRRVPVTAFEREILEHGMRWLDEPEESVPFEAVAAVAAASQAEIDRYLQRWRFVPAAPAGDAQEKAAVATVSEQPAARALLTAWRVGPDGDRTRAYCVVCDRDGWLAKVWGRVHQAMVFAHDRPPARLDVLLEAVRDGEPWTPYQRRLVQAAAPVWTRDGRRLDRTRLLGDQPEPFELVELGEDVGCSPGLPEHDGGDEAVAGGAAGHDRVLAVTRCWAQPAGDDRTRTRVYGVLVDAPDMIGRVRQECAEVVRRASGGPVAIEVAVPAEAPQRHRRLLDQSVVLWQQDDRSGSE